MQQGMTVDLKEVSIDVGHSAMYTTRPVELRYILPKSPHPACCSPCSANRLATKTVADQASIDNHRWASSCSHHAAPLPQYQNTTEAALTSARPIPQSLPRTSGRRRHCRNAGPPSRKHNPNLTRLPHSPNKRRTRLNTLSLSGSYGWSFDGISSSAGKAAVYVSTFGRIRSAI